MSFRKTLTANDLGYSKGHQVGIHISKKAQDETTFPYLDVKLDEDSDGNASRDLLINGPNETLWYWRFIWYNNRLREGTRNEYRLTAAADPHLTQKEKTNYSPVRFMKYFSLAIGDVLEFHKLDENELSVTIFKEFSSENTKSVSDSLLKTTGNPRLHQQPGPPPRNAGYTIPPRNPYSDTEFVYIAQYGSSNVYKIGRTNLPKRRLREFNQYIPTQELNISAWAMLNVSKALTSDVAHQLEQSILKKDLSSFVTNGERFQCSDSVVQDVARRYAFKNYESTRLV